MANPARNAEIGEAKLEGNVESISTVEISVVNLQGVDGKEIGDFFDRFGTVVNVQIKRKFQTAFPIEDGVVFSEKRLCTEKNKLVNNLPVEKLEKSSFESVTTVMLQREVVEKIFSFLDIEEQIQLESVCKQWRQIGKDCFWRRIKKLNLRPYIRNRPARFTTDAVVEGILSRCGTHLEQVKFTGTRIEESIDEYKDSILRSLHLIAQSCPNLLQIDCYHAPITKEGLLLLAQNCPNLETLVLKNSVHFITVGLDSFVKVCKTLKRLQISSSDDSYDDYFKVCIQNNNLRFLRIYHGGTILTTKVFETLINRLCPLEEIHLPCCYVSAASLFKLFSRDKNTIKELYFETIPSFDDARMEWCEALCLLSNLVRLSLRLMGVDDTICSILANNCMKLEHLDIRLSRVTDSGLFHLANLPLLKFLDLSCARNITSIGIVALAKRGTLEKLFLGKCCIQDTDVACSSLARYCQNFTLLDASYSDISNLVVRSFVKAIESGFLKKRVVILVYSTDVDLSVKRCEKLHLEFRCPYWPLD